MTDSEKLDLLLEKFIGFEKRLDNMENDIRGTKLHLENSTDKNIQVLAENHINLSDKLNEAIPAVNKNSMYEIKVNYLIDKVDKLEKEMLILKAQ